MYDIMGNFLSVILLSTIIFIAYRRKINKKREKNVGREIIVYIFWVYFLMLLFITIFKGFSITFNNPFDSYMYKNEGISGIINMIPLKETINTLTNGFTPIMNPLRNIVGNILLFVPLGFAIPILFRKYDDLFKIFKLGFICSFMIEFTQLFVGQNICDIDDIIFNTTGAILGYLLFKLTIYILLKIKIIFKEDNIINKGAIKIEEVLDKVCDEECENIFRKSVRFILLIGILCIIIYIGAFFTQTSSINVSDEELLNKLIPYEVGNVVISKTIDEDKYILVENDYYYEVLLFEKITKNRYICSSNSNSSYINEKSTYMADIMYKDFSEENSNELVVIGRNSDASKIKITVEDKIYEEDINRNEDFLVILPKDIKLDDQKLFNLYEGKEDYIKIEFLDEEDKKIDFQNIITTDGW